MRTGTVHKEGNMPRKTGVTANFKPPADATNQDVVDALEANAAALLEDVSGKLEEGNVAARQTHLGHEAHDWDAEVTAEDVEEG